MRPQRAWLLPASLLWLPDWLGVRIPNDLFVECLNMQLLRRETRDTPCPRGFPEWWFVKLED